MDSRHSRSEFVGHPGPLDAQLLCLQAAHRSESVWQNSVRACTNEPFHDDTNQPLTVKRTSLTKAEYEINNDRFIYWMSVAGFLGVFQIGYHRIDGALVTALLERWRPETHTFHMPEGEMTVTLQDVAILLGLRIHGNAIIGLTDYDVPDWCIRCLNEVPEPSDMKRRWLSLKWLATKFNLTSLSPDATDDTVQCYVRATILRMIGGDLLGTKTEGYVHCMFFPFVEDIQQIQGYSWGSACLAYLYHNLCNAAIGSVSQISGPLLLLQLWAWERFSQCRPVMRTGAEHTQFLPLGTRWGGYIVARQSPTFHLQGWRYEFDIQTHYQVCWEPYTQFLHQLDPVCLSGQDIWTARVPLICFNIVEWHYPDRVRRQFGWRQFVPTSPYCHTVYHSTTQRGKHERDWREIWGRELDIWNNRHQYVVHSNTVEITHHYHNEYMDWYRRVTRRFMTVEGAAHVASIDTHERVWMSSRSDISQSGRHYHQMAGSMLGAFGEQRRYMDFPHESSSMDDMMMPDYGFSPADIAPSGPRPRSRRQSRMSVDPPRASCDSVFRPPDSIPASTIQTTFVDPFMSSMQAGSSTFTPARTSLAGFPASSGFGSYYSPGPSSQPSPSQSSFSTFMNFSQPIHLGFSAFGDGSHSGASVGSDVSTPTTAVFAPFHTERTSTGSNLRPPNISSMRSSLAGDDDDEDGEDDDENRDDDDRDDDDRDVMINQSPRRKTTSKFPFLKKILPHRNRRRPGCGT